MSDYTLNLSILTLRTVLQAAADIFIIWLILYYVLRIVRNNSRTIQIFKGIMMFVLFDVCAGFLGLKTVKYFADIFLNWGILAIFIIFQPEFRTLLEKIGKTNFFASLHALSGNEKENIVDQIVSATMLLSSDQTGALISIERSNSLDDFIETGSGGGIGFGLCDDITHAVIDEEKMTSLRKYHTITEAKNGAGATPIKTDKGWIHIAHGVRNTAAGLRYVIYAFATDLKDPSKVISEPSGLLIGPRGEERVGDVSNVVFTNGAIVNEKNEVFLYYASSDTRMHVATTTIDKLKDYVFNTPSDPGRSVECVAQRYELIRKNMELLK